MLFRLKEKYFGDRNFYHKLIVLIIPIIIQQGITNFVSLLDNVMVGQLGTQSMSGVAIVNQLLFVFQIIIFGGLAGASIYGAQFNGKGDHVGMRYTFRFKIILGVAVVIITTGILVGYHEVLISLFLHDESAPEEVAFVLREAKNYLYVMLIGSLPFAISQCYASSLRETGETVSPMIASTIAILLNLILNYILIFGNFGAPKLGVVGAAIATVIARYVEAVFLMIRTHRNHHRFHFIEHAYQSLYIPADIVKKICITGWPLLLNEIFWSTGQTVINQSYSTRGLVVVAAMNITSTVWNLFCIVMFSMGTAISVLVGQLLGAGEIEEAKKTDTKLLFFSVVLHVVIGSMIILLSPVIPKMYNTEEAVRLLTQELLVVAGLALPIHAMVHGTYFTLRCGGKTIMTFFFDCVFTWCVTLPIAFCTTRFTSLGIVAIYFCVQFAESVKILIGLKLLKSGKWANNMVEH